MDKTDPSFSEKPAPGQREALYDGLILVNLYPKSSDEIVARFHRSGKAEIRVQSSTLSSDRRELTAEGRPNAALFGSLRPELKFP
jgi:hypothetical protein